MKDSPISTGRSDILNLEGSKSVCCACRFGEAVVCTAEFAETICNSLVRCLVLLQVRNGAQAVWKGAPGKSHSLHTRGIVELAGAISCGTGRSPLAYIGYGCYCGLGGQGWPKDKTDWCCHRHDCCYDKAEKAGCSPKAQRYQWACEQNAVRCDNLTDQCEKMVCQCDQEAAKCWGAAPYNPHFILWPDFLCGQTHPTCHFRYGGTE
ncbi:phospholipase A2-like isoform X1 [Strix uralensis]|uniref:phospholipase A2-like isoform X1 n=1 Tax=Strix uralensis TaxID=36305 RepID=UPI003DA6F1FC